MCHATGQHFATIKKPDRAGLLRRTSQSRWLSLSAASRVKPLRRSSGSASGSSWSSTASREPTRTTLDRIRAVERAAGRHGLSRFELESQRFRHAAFTLLSTSPLALASRPRIGRVRGCWRLNGFVEAIEAVEAVGAVGAVEAVEVDGSGWKHRSSRRPPYASMLLTRDLEAA